jgi:hypothetical protein
MKLLIGAFARYINDLLIGRCSFVRALINGHRPANSSVQLARLPAAHAFAYFAAATRMSFGSTLAIKLKSLSR